MAALVLAAATALTVAVRMGAAAGAHEGDPLALMRAATDRRVAAELAQIRPALEAEAAGDSEGACRTAEAALGRLGGNSQLHLFLAGVYRERGETAPALREYRRAVELLRDLADRRSPRFIGASLSPWFREIRNALAGPARSDLHYLERALAGGCS
jgi:Tfp pilus assembly protein PilF